MDIGLFCMRKSPADHRDWIYGSKKISSNMNIPEVLDYREQLHPIRDQGNHGSCYAMSACAMKEWQEKHDYGLEEYLSPKFFYAQRQNIKDDDKRNDYGMYSRDVMKILRNIGICRESLCEYKNVDKPLKNANVLFKDARHHTILHYARVHSLETAKSALFEKGLCLITFPVYDPTQTQFWKKSKDFPTFNGGHAMTLVGYTKTHFIIRNSWGKRWGDKGYCYYPFEDWGEHWEIWLTTDTKTDIEPVPVPEPVSFFERIKKCFRMFFKICIKTS